MNLPDSLSEDDVIHELATALARAEKAEHERDVAITEIGALSRRCVQAEQSAELYKSRFERVVAELLIHDCGTYPWCPRDVHGGCFPDDAMGERCLEHVIAWLDTPRPKIPSEVEEKFNKALSKEGSE
jgi:hypothetical protein